MNTVGGYFVNKMEDCIGIKENIIIGRKYRFTILTNRLIRLEYSPNGIFEDRPTQRVIFRKFPKVNFQVSQTEMLLQLTTDYFTLDYVKNSSFMGGKFSPGSNLRITLNKTERIWYYNHPEARNFGGITYSLDDFQGNLKLEKGLYSTDGFACLDDSDSLVLDGNGNFSIRQNKELDLYIFMYRKDLGLCLQDYYTLTGYPMLLPRYAFGTWWYKNTKYNKESLKELLTRFKDEKIPLASVLLGDKWHVDGEPFIFDESELSPADLKELSDNYGVNFGLTIDPGAKVTVDSSTYQGMMQSGYHLDGKDYSVLPFNNQSLNLYSSYGIRNWISMGMSSFYVDYNNINDKNTLSLVAHYCYAMSNMLVNQRNVVFSRNYGLAPHRNTVIFTGKTKVDWNTLAVLPRYNATASNSGLSYVANAIGGYYGGVENFELYIRYIQLGVFSSMMVLASDDGKYYKREPWKWNEVEFGVIKKYLILRNRLIPYLYTESYIYHKSGSPMAQPLYYKYPKIYDEPLYKNQYFFGSQMLVCPITKKKNVIMNRVVQRMFIPEGVWYEFESGKKYVGNKYYMSFYKDEDYPVFCKEGAIIPLSLDDTAKVPESLEFIVVPGCDGEYKLYEDDGIGNGFKNGIFSITELQFRYEKNSYELIIRNNNNPGILPTNRNYRIRFKNTKECDVSIMSGNSIIQGKCDLERNDFIIDIENISTTDELRIRCSGEGTIVNSTIRLINDDIRGILEDLEIETTLKEKIDKILFGDLPIKKKRIAIRKLKRSNLEPKFIKMFLNLLEYIETV